MSEQGKNPQITEAEIEEVLSDLDLDAVITCHHPLADNGM